MPAVQVAAEPAEISVAELLGRRLNSQLVPGQALSEASAPVLSPATSPVAVVRHLLALQAQDFGQALWAIGLRARTTRPEVISALETGAIVRSAPMRGTLHFLAAEDLRWMLALTAERTLASAVTRHLRLGLTEETFRRARQIAATELAGGARLSRDEFISLLNADGIETNTGRGYHLIFHLAQQALICWGPPRGNQQALVLVDEWIAPQHVPERSVALGELARRYFLGHGPATVKDFAWWSKLTMADVRAGVAAAREHLAEFRHGGQQYFGATDAASSSSAHALALPAFDEFLLGYGDRSADLEARFASRIVPGDNGIFQPVIVVDGRVVGTWRREPARRGSAPASAAGSVPASIALLPFEPLSAADDRMLRLAASQFLEFVSS